MTTLFGRERELARAGSFLESETEQSSVLLFEGAAGIGKTTLWRAGVERARERGFRVLEARPAAAERDLSFVALGDLLSETHDEIGGLPALQRRALRIALLLEEAKGKPTDQRAVGAALLELLRRLATEEPILVALDDVQWLDTPSASALEFAQRRLGEAPVRVLASLRTGSTFESFEAAERIEVGPLGLGELDQLIRARLGVQLLRPTLHQLEEASGGNPFYALELATGLLRSGHRLEPGEPMPVPARLHDVVRDRLALLAPAARKAALAAAALSQPTVAVIQKATGGDVTGVNEAVGAGVLDRDGEVLRFTHPLFASTLYEDSAPEEKRDLHRRLAKVVGAPEERARHLAEATTGPDEIVAAALEVAATSVFARGAADAAVRLARQAFELTPPDRRAEAHDRCLAWARYSVAAGDPLHAEALLERQIEQLDSGGQRAAAELELGRARLGTLGMAAALACYERAVRELEGTDELELETMVLIEVAEVHVGEQRLSSDAPEQAIVLAEKLGRPDLLARALGIHGMKLTLQGQPPPDEFWLRALELEESSGAMSYDGPGLKYARAVFMRGECQTTMELIRRAAGSMERTGDPALPNVLVGLCECARISGDLEAAAGYAEEAHDLAVQTGRESLEPMCLLWQARVALPRGDLDRARHDAEEALQVLEGLVPSEFERIEMEWLTKSIFGQIAQVSERPAEAHECFAAAIELAEQHLPGTSQPVTELLAADVECLVALGALADARRQLQRLVALTDRLEIPRLAGFTARAQGLVAAAEGDSAAAIDYLERAVECMAGLQMPWPLEDAKTLLMLGGVQRRARQNLAARTTLGAALATFERLGARLWVEKTRAELSQIGGRSSRPGVLTATEQSVARLVAAGHSNVEVAHELFMSPKTVEWNLSKIYKKLHVRSRTELAVKLAK